jgi:hypothetical protein
VAGEELTVDDSHGPPGVLVAVTDHALERFRQRVASRRGELDPRPEIASRVAQAWSQRRISDHPPDRHGVTRPQRGRIYVHDINDRDLIFVCGHDQLRGELIVITLWERERLGDALVPRRFTDALERRPRRRQERAAQASTSSESLV